MAIALDLGVQFVQMLLVLAAAPLLTGYVRKVKAHLVRRQGPPLLQPYRDLIRLLRKDVVLADTASWFFRVAPYLIFAATWVAAALVPTFATGLIFSYAADVIAIVALLASARFVLALAENARIPVDNPATHLELTMVHEAMILEYSGRHLALIELASQVKLVLYVSLIACVFFPWGIATAGAGAAAYLGGIAVYALKLAAAGFALGVFETLIAKMRVFRVSDFLGAALMLGLLATLLRFVSSQIG